MLQLLLLQSDNVIFIFPANCTQAKSRTLVYLHETKFYYRTCACDSAQNGVQVEKFMTILWPVRSDASFKAQLILY